MEEDEIFIKNVQEIIQHNLNNPNLKGDFIAKKLGLNRMQLYRKLKKIKNLDARTFITTIRVGQAKKMLENTSKFTYQITKECGFKHYTHFSKVFKKQIGVSPSIYRKQNQK
ncbi:MAG: helix-turn-helix domain-containing protein [Saprospiraceae bacterium]